MEIRKKTKTEKREEKKEILRLLSVTVSGRTIL